MSCGSREIFPDSIPDAGPEFSPIKKGNAWVYQVDTITYISKFDNALNKTITDTLSGTYFLKEIIGDSIALQQGNPLFRVEVYRAADSTGPWVIDSVWSIQRGVEKIMRTENNIPIVSLKFPVTEKSRWDGNQYNLLQDSSGSNWFSVRDFKKSSTFKGKSFPSFRIIQKSDSNCLGKTDVQVLYLKEIGPAFIRKSEILFSQEGPDPCGNLPRIESGKVRNYSLIQFEKGL